MKLDPSRIVFDHWATLRNAETGERSLKDIFLFYGIPMFMAAASYWTTALSARDFYSISITFFGIFIALLLNLQVAMFSIFQRNWNRPHDERSAAMQKDRLDNRVNLLEEINANTSYSILFSTLSLIVFIILYAMNMQNLLPTAISIFIYAHFTLTLLMIIKRSHILFEREYRNGP